MRFFSVLFLLYTSCVFGLQYQLTPKVANGKTALLRVEKSDTIHYKKVVFDKKSFPFIEEGEALYALIPVSYYAKAGKKTVVLHYTQGEKEKKKLLTLRVVYGDYKKESIHVSAAKVNPKAPDIKKRIAQEYREAMDIYNHVSSSWYVTKPFVLPLQSKITSDFGKARIYNGSLKGYHSGTDFRAKVGTPVDASNAGKVVLVKKRFYSGGTVIIDHGKGLYTCYFHLSKFLVHKGDMVQRNQLIGLSGKSGRVTGPHLHFAARINGVQVDPLQLIKLVNFNVLEGKKQ